MGEVCSALSVATRMQRAETRQLSKHVQIKKVDLNFKAGTEPSRASQSLTLILTFQSNV